MLTVEKTQNIFTKSVYVVSLSLLWLLTACTATTSMPDAQPLTAISTPTPTTTPNSEGVCEYAVEVRDAETKASISDAKLTLTYQLDTLQGYTGSEGRYRGQFRCDDEQQRYRLRIEADDYQPYETELLVREEIETIYLVSTQIKFCEYVIAVMDEASLSRIANAKVRVEYGLYRATGYTNSEGDYASQLPCAEELPAITIYVEADNYATYSDDYTLQNEIKEIRLTLIATPTPTPTPTLLPTPTLFPPRAEGETLVLVADILVPGCAKNPACTNDDPDDVSQRLVSTMRKNLADHPDIRIERLPLFIEEEGGSEKVMALGRSPEFDATFIIWGNYLEAPEVYLFFDIMQTELPFFGSSYDSAYGPSQILQPSMFEFKADLGAQWAQITAFATGLALFQVSGHAGAEPLFNTAAQVLNAPAHLAVDDEMVRMIYFYRGTNYNELGRANLAEPDLRTLYEMFDPEVIAQNELGVHTLNNLGIAYENLGQYERAIEFYEQALAIAQEIKDRSNEGIHLGNLGIAYFSLGQYEAAIEFYEQALAIAQEIKDRRGEGNHLGNLGLAYADLGQYERAIENYEQALAIAQEIKDRRGEGNRLGNLGNAYSSLGQYKKAIENYEQALAIAQEIKDRRGEGIRLGSLGNAYRNLGQYDKAIEFHESALVISREIKDRRGEGNHLGNLGIAYADLGEYDKAIEFYEQALAIAQEIKDRRGEGMRLGYLGNAYRNLREYDKAIPYLVESFEILSALRSPHASFYYRKLGSAYNSACWSTSLSGQPDVALPYCEEAVLHDAESYAYLDSRGLAYALLGETDKAIADFQFAVDAAKALDNSSYESFITERQAWIDALKVEENPFTDEVLAELRGE